MEKEKEVIKITDLNFKCKHCDYCNYTYCSYWGKDIDSMLKWYRENCEMVFLPLK